MSSHNWRGKYQMWRTADGVSHSLTHTKVLGPPEKVLRWTAKCFSEIMFINWVDIKVYTSCHLLRSQMITARPVEIRVPP